MNEAYLVWIQDGKVVGVSRLNRRGASQEWKNAKEGREVVEVPLLT